MSEFDAWDSFYVIIGSAAGALSGLQFVVVTLVAEKPSLRATEAGAAFATPTIVHFSAVLLVSALIRIPRHTIAPLAVLWGVIGLGGLAYELAVARHLRRQVVYPMQLEDWTFHLLLPSVGYAILVGSAVAAWVYERESLFGAATAALMLLFIGIHNSWDSIAYHVSPSHMRAESEPNTASRFINGALSREKSWTSNVPVHRHQRRALQIGLQAPSASIRYFKRPNRRGSLELASHLSRERVRLGILIRWVKRLSLLLGVDGRNAQAAQLKKSDPEILFGFHPARNIGTARRPLRR